MVIDFHTHAFPDSLAPRAISSLVNKGGINPYDDGTISGLVDVMDCEGVDISVILNIATKPEQETNVNNFALSLTNHNRVIGLGSVFPKSETSLSEVERLKAGGVKGIKMHPEYQNFDILDEGMFPLYEKCAELSILIQMHTGGDVAYSAPYHTSPQKLEKLVSMFPKTTFVFAHMGGYEMWHNAADILTHHDNMYIDTSMINTIAKIDNDDAKRIIENVGEDRVVFGSDMPWGMPSHSMNKILSLKLGKDVEDKIFYKNAVKLLELDL